MPRELVFMLESPRIYTFSKSIIIIIIAQVFGGKFIIINKLSTSKAINEVYVNFFVKLFSCHIITNAT